MGMGWLLRTVKREGAKGHEGTQKDRGGGFTNYDGRFTRDEGVEWSGGDTELTEVNTEITEAAVSFEAVMRGLCIKISNLG